jgi:hypothetical protein
MDEAMLRQLEGLVAEWALRGKTPAMVRDVLAQGLLNLTPHDEEYRYERDCGHVGGKKLVLVYAVH